MFEEKSAEELARLLRQFYAEVRNQKGQPYSRSSLVGIRASIQRHLESPPYNCTYSIVTDSIFKPANTVLVSRIKLNRIQGNDTTTHKYPIQEDDIQKMYDTKVLSNQNPKALQFKVFFEICLHFVRRGKEGLRELRKDSFMVKTDDQGCRYVTITYNEKTKKDQGDSLRSTLKEQRMYEIPNDPLDPVKSFELYISKLHPNCNDFFQLPKADPSDEIWYYGRPVGANKIGTFMQEISKASGLSRIYTNHCVRATAVTVLCNAGVEENDVICVSGHKNVQSLAPYRQSVSDSKRKSMSNCLASFGRSSSEGNKENVPPLPVNVTTTTTQAQQWEASVLQGNTFNASEISVHVHVHNN